MAFHELGTNAIKYGALSVPEGSVTISWKIQKDGNDAPMLDIYWQEKGGPIVVEPTRKGFGSKLITAAFAQTAGHVAQVAYLPAGIQFHVRFALKERVEKQQ